MHRSGVGRVRGSVTIMNKTLKFDTHLIPLILKGEKKSTWRIFDDKDLKNNDIVDFLDTSTKEKFATVRLTKVIEKPFSELNEEDWSGHEKYNSDKEMYEHYTKAYSTNIGPETKVKIIWFEIIP